MVRKIDNLFLQLSKITILGTLFFTPLLIDLVNDFPYIVPKIILIHGSAIFLSFLLLVRILLWYIPNLYTQPLLWIRRFKISGIFMAVLGFVITLIITLPFSFNQQTSWLGSAHLYCDGLSTTIAYFIFFVGTVQIIYQELTTSISSSNANKSDSYPQPVFRVKFIELFIPLITIVTIIVVGYALVQRWGVDPLRYLYPHAQERPFATLGNPIYLGNYLIITVPFLWFLMFSSTRLLTLLLFTILYGGICIALFITGARSVWLTFLVGLGLWLVSYRIIATKSQIRLPLQKISRTILIVVPVLVYLSFILLLSTDDPLSHRAQRPFSTAPGISSYIPRKLVLQSSLLTVKDWELTRSSDEVVTPEFFNVKIIYPRSFYRILSGNGLASNLALYQHYKTEEILHTNDRDYMFHVPHNELIQMFTTTGITGSASYLWVVITIIGYFIFFLKHPGLFTATYLSNFYHRSLDGDKEFFISGKNAVPSANFTPRLFFLCLLVTVLVFFISNQFNFTTPVTGLYGWVLMGIITGFSFTELNLHTIPNYPGTKLNKKPTVLFSTNLVLLIGLVSVWLIILVPLYNSVVTLSKHHTADRYYLKGVELIKFSTLTDGKAVHYFQQADWLNPRELLYPEMYYQIYKRKSTELWNSGKKELAVFWLNLAFDSLKEKVYLNPYHAGLWCILGRYATKLYELKFSLNKSGKIKDDTALLLKFAESAHRQAINLAPYQADSWQSLGRLYWFSGRIKESLFCWRKALEIDNRISFRTEEDFGNPETIVPRVAPVIKQLRSQSIELSKSQIKDLGLAYFLIGDFGNAINWFLKVLPHEPNNWYVSSRLAAAYFALGNYEEGLFFYRQADKANFAANDILLNQTVQYYFELGKNQFYTAQFRSAIDTFTKIIVLKPDFVSAYSNLGVIYNYLGNYKTAVNYLTEAVKFADYDSSVHCNLAASYQGLKKFGLALNEYTYAANLNPNLANAYLGIGQVKFKMHDYPGAKIYLRYAIKLDPTGNVGESSRRLLVQCKTYLDKTSFTAEIRR